MLGCGDNMDTMFSLSFEDYIIYRTNFAIDKHNKNNLFDLEYGLPLLQALWVREYWFNKNLEN